MSLKQIAVSAALMGNGVAAVKLSLGSGPAFGPAGRHKKRCVHYIDYRRLVLKAKAEEKRAQREDEVKANPRGKPTTPQLTHAERQALTADKFNSAKTYASICHEAGGYPKAINEIASQATAYADEMKFRAQQFLNLEAWREEDLPKPKSGVARTFGQKGFDYKDYFNKFLHKEAKYVVFDEITTKTVKDQYQVDASFVAHCCSVPPKLPAKPEEPEPAPAAPVADDKPAEKPDDEKKTEEGECCGYENKETEEGAATKPAAPAATEPAAAAAGTPVEEKPAEKPDDNKKTEEGECCGYKNKETEEGAEKKEK